MIAPFVGIDFGNSRIKIYGYNADYQLDFVHITDLESGLSAIQQIAPLAKMPKVIYCRTGRIPSEIVSYLEALGALNVHSGLRLPFALSHAFPEKIGQDRLCVASALQARYPNLPSLAIDIGTCLTVEWMENGRYCGGIISPGLEMRWKAMHTFTEGLPLLPMHSFSEEHGLPTQTTESNMYAGAFYGMLHEIKGWIMNFRSRFPEAPVILCGGDAQRFAKHMENSIFVADNLVAEGMAFLLQYNKA
jgi:type III pantothenate kinase